MSSSLRKTSQTSRQRWHARRSLVALALVSLLLPGSLASQDAPLIARGDAVVTAFSGAMPDAEIFSGQHPLDRTFIDLDGNSAQVFDMSMLGSAPRGQLADAPPKLQVKARDIGQVFGVALDDGNGADAPNAYLAATSRFGLQIVNVDQKGAVTRMLRGAPGATWMPGQFGPNGTPGSIWKLEGATGAVSLFADIKVDGRDNGGAALGNIAFDDASRQLYVADLSTGLVHHLSLDGRDLGTYDHGTTGRAAQGLDSVADDPSRHTGITSEAFDAEDATTWGYADDRRRVFALATNNGRLYYSVGEGPSVWSVSIDDKGRFGSDARIEIALEGSPPGTDITDILFDDDGRLYLSQRGTPSGSYDFTGFALPQQSLVLRYTWSDAEGRWLATPEEYAIGLTPEHRETQGGIALDYGYDKNGNIDYGACRQTLWTTGEHLREGEDAVRVSTGGQQIVHGLQGNYIARVRPANAPPYESWFTDYDDRFEDANVYGHVGAVAIFAPCDRPAPIGYTPPADSPSLILDKQCAAAAIGGKVKCTITVSNVSNHALSEDVKVTDVTEVLKGPGAGSLMPVAAFSVPLSAISCSETPTPDFACVIPLALLPGGVTIAIDVWIDTQDFAPKGDLGFTNCALIKHPDGSAKACARGGTDIIVEKIGPGICLSGGTCKFGMRIANTGQMPFSGNVALADAMTVGGAIVNAPVTAVTPPIGCSVGDTNQLPFTCIANVSLQPGEEQVHEIEVTMTAPGNSVAQNCLGLVDPVILPPGPLPPDFLKPGGKINPSCVIVHVPAPVANLKIEKTAAGEGKCQKAPGGMTCAYDVSFTNQNNADFNAPLAFDEVLPPGASVSAVAQPFICSGGPPVTTCASTGPALIPAGSTLTTQVTISVPFASVEALQCKIANTAKITVPPGGAAPNVDAGDDQANALASMAGLELLDPQTQQTKVFCDPTNLKVTKVASGDCSRSGDAWECLYDASVLNTGPDPYKGPVKLDETLDGAPTSVSFDGDFECTGGGATFSCATEPLTLDPGSALKLRVRATLPDNGTCRLPNVARLTAPLAGSRGNGDGSDDEAKATADIPSPRCRPPATLIPAGLPACAGGLPRRADGTCPCPLGWAWSGRRFACEPPPRLCFDPVRRRDDGGCCPLGTYYDERIDICRTPPPVCGDPERRRSDGSCCPIGTVVGMVGNRCIPIATACPYGTRWNYVLRTCMPDRPTCPGYYNWRRRICEPIRKTCPFGTRWDVSQRECVPDRVFCPRGERWDPVRRACAAKGDGDHGGPCAKGHVRVRGHCVPPPGPGTCPPGKHRVGAFCMPDRIVDGRPCGPGRKRAGTLCVPDAGGPVQTCPAGTYRLGRRCVGDATTPVMCPTGQHRVGRHCVPDKGGATGGPGSAPNCPAGTRRIGQYCIPGGINIVCPAGKHRVGRTCVDNAAPLPPCPAGQRRAGRACVPNVVAPPVCANGMRRVGNGCVPDRVLPPRRPPVYKPPVVKPPAVKPKPIGCPAGTHRAGAACVPNVRLPPKILKRPGFTPKAIPNIPAQQHKGPYINVR